MLCSECEHRRWEEGDPEYSPPGYGEYYCGVVISGCLSEEVAKGYVEPINCPLGNIDKPSIKTKIETTAEFEIESNQIVISDPCYKLPVTCSKVVNILPGTYIASVRYSDRHIAKLSITHKDWVGKITDQPELISDNIGVDSGQCGFFDAKYYRQDSYYRDVERISKNEPIKRDETFYSICCDRVSTKKRWGVIPHGVVSSSGFGDWTYCAHGNKLSDGNYVRLELTFI